MNRSRRAAGRNITAASPEWPRQFPPDIAARQPDIPQVTIAELRETSAVVGLLPPKAPHPQHASDHRPHSRRRTTRLLRAEQYQFVGHRSRHSGAHGARGCFLIGTALTEAVLRPDVRETLAAGLQEIDDAFEARMRVAQQQGDLPASADPAILAKLASAVLHTLAIRSRSGEPRAALDAIIEPALDLICGPARPAGTKPTGRKATARERAPSSPGPAR